MLSTTTDRVAGAAVMAVLVVGMSGCELVPRAQPAPPPPATVTVTQPEGPTEETSSGAEEPAAESTSDDGACASENLSPRLTPEFQADQTSDVRGRDFTRLALTNTGSSACTIDGYPAVKFVDAAGNPLPTSRDRVKGEAYYPIELQPGETAASHLFWGVTEQPCVTPAELQVTPPGADSAVTVEWKLTSVCGNGRLEVTGFDRAVG